MEKPIVSLNFGCAAIFLIGGRTKEERPVPILIRSGDVLLMSGESRFCFHGVPCILPNSFEVPEKTETETETETETDPLKMHIKNGDNDEHVLLDYLGKARININVRQVTVDANADSWVDKCGSGAMNMVGR